MPLPDQLAGLLDPESYPHSCGEIRLVETHISWVLLTGEYAYKLKKPVHFNFVDFSTLELREHFCREELRCNRAFAAELYLDVVGVVGHDGGVAVVTEPESAPLEWAVKMRQFDPELALDRLLEREGLDPGMLRGFGAALAARHRVLPVLEGDPAEVPRRVFGPVRDNFAEIEGTGLADRHRSLLDRARIQAEDLGERYRPRFEDRISNGWIRECHGDLHLSNLALVDGEVTAFDCLEFNENLRWIDTVSDVAFLFMDCHVRNELACAYAFLDGYLEVSGDYDGIVLLPYFSAYRSVVRAKVAALRWVQEETEAGEAKFLEHLRWAADLLSRPSGKLFITCGLSGSGKSVLASRLLPELPAIRLRSDVARKRLAGLDVLEDSQSPVDGGLYGSEQSDRTFEFLAEVAEALLLAGENVIVDATFIERARRDRFAAAAQRVGAGFRVLLCDAPEDVLRERVVARARDQRDPSEATVEVLELQLDRFDRPGDDEPVVTVDTSAPLDDAALNDLVRLLVKSPAAEAD
jgi:aminoglycoside phosphotransferase family enzyme/predicted kinase